MKYICNRCDYKCSSNRDLNKHIKYVHDKLKDVHCDMCDYKCSEKVNLKKHIKYVHDKVKDVCCDMCNYKCSEMVNLKKHIKHIHDKIKDFCCAQCEYKCSEHSTLKKHIKAIHTNPKPRSMSRGEQKINNYLKKLGINFIREATFNELIGLSGGLLRFDFRINEGSQPVFIEFDGKQHYEPVKWNSNESAEDVLAHFKVLRTHDRIKNDYCKDEGYELLRIRYDQIDIAEAMIKAFINLHCDVMIM